MRPASEAQKAFARDIAFTLDLTIPDEDTAWAYSEFISEYRDEFYAARRRGDGYGFISEANNNVTDALERKRRNR